MAICRSLTFKIKTAYIKTM